MCHLRYSLVLAAGLILAWTMPAQAKIEIVVPDGTPDGATFERNIRDQLNDLRGSSNPHLWKLIHQADRAPVTITIMPTPDDDPKTWCGKKSPRVSCTRTHPSVKGKVSRNTPRPAVIYFIPHHVDLSHPKAHRGIVAHELSHAVDRAYGLYHKEKEIRERRAMVFHNMWRDDRGLKLFKKYNKKFVVTDYQTAKARGQLAQLADHIFRHDGLPR